MNLVEMRDRARNDLQDTEPADYRWTDPQIDGAIYRALREYSLAAPIQKQDDLPTVSGDREIDITTLSRLIKIESLEFPIGLLPPSYRHISYWAGRLAMQEDGDGNDARIRWWQAHHLDAVSTTVPQEHREVIILGATGYLAMSASAYSVDRASIAGRHATINYRAWGRERLASYEWKLKAIGAGRRVITRTLYTGD